MCPTGDPRIVDNDVTYFASARRAPPDHLARLLQFSLADPIVQAILTSVHGYVLILGATRQILAANDELLAAFELEYPEVLGRRPGELLECVQLKVAPSGCGTSPNCRYCGALLSILTAVEDRRASTDECLLLTEREGKLNAVEYSLKSTPLQLADEGITVFVFQDISAHKRREVLERVFLHDIANLAGGLAGLAETLADIDPEDAAHKISYISGVLAREIQTHRLLLDAEQDTLVVRPAVTPVQEIFREVESVFVSYSGGHRDDLRILFPSTTVALHCDPRLIHRVLTNMVKNALEATDDDEVVELRFIVDEGKPGFVVTNGAIIPPEVRSLIFKRSFSTKGTTGRGLGTYSMKLFGERYLGGRVWFTSTEQEGTRFCFFLPESALVRSD